MERYSTLYGAHTIVNDRGKEINQYLEVGRSPGLNEYLRKQNIPNPTMAAEDVNAVLTGFVELPGYNEQPADLRPMLVRYAPMHLKRLERYEGNVQSFNAIACSAPDHQVGNRDGKYRNTHYIDRSLLLDVGEYNFLDQIFGTHLISWKENQDVREYPIDYDAPPEKAEPALRERDARLVQIVAAALINKASVVLKLEKGCIFQLRSMELLKAIYALFAPIQAAEIGFASYEDPANISKLIERTAIRLFVVPAEVDLGAVAGRPNMLVLDLNKELEKPKGNDLLRAMSVWYRTPWKDRVRIMNALFSDMADPNDVQTYVERTLKYRDASGAMAAKLKESRETVASLEELKRLYDSFGELMTIPVLYERFCSAAPRLMKLPEEYAQKANNGRELRQQVNRWIKSQIATMGAAAVMEKRNGEDTGKATLFKFGTDVFKTSVNMEMSRQVAERTENQTTVAVEAKKEQEFATEREKIAKERADFDNRLQAAVNAEIARGKAEVEAEQANTQRVQNELAQARIDHQNALKAEQARGQDAVSKAVAAGQAAVQAEQAKTQQVQGELAQARIDHQNALKTEQERRQEAVDAEKTRGENNLSKERANHKAEIEKLNAELESKKQELLSVVRGHVPMTRICGLNVPTIAKSLVILAAVVGIVVGLIAGGVLGGVIGSKLGKREEAPVIVEPAQTTQPTLPIETTQPTEPAETTQPTEPRTLLVNGEIDWDYVYENMSDIMKLEHEAAAMETLLNEMNITAEGRADELEAVLTFASGQDPAFLTIRRTPVEQQEPAQSDETTAAPEETTEATEETTGEDAEETTGETTGETEPVVLLLAEMEPSFVADNGTYRFEIFCEPTSRRLREAVAVVQQFLCELPEDPAKMLLTAMTAEDKVVDLHGLMTEVSGNELWWKQSFELDLDEDSRYTRQKDMDTSRKPAMMIRFEDETEALVYDYSDDTKKREDMVGILEKQGYDGAFNEEIVIGLTAKQEAAAPAQESGDSQGEA